MPSNKKSFILHHDSLSVLDELTDEEAGKLFKAIKAHHLNEEIELDSIIRIVFSPFKNQFIRDLEKYTNTCAARAVAGSSGGKQKAANVAKASKSKQKVANVADSESDNDSESDKDSKKERFNICLKHFNDKTGKKFKTAKGLSTRLNDYSVDEVKSVIDSKTIEWLGDDQMEKYLRPETIFGSKFEGYLNNILSGIDGKPKPKDGGASGPDWKKGLSPEQINQMQGNQ